MFASIACVILKPTKIGIPSGMVLVVPPIHEQYIS